MSKVLSYRKKPIVIQAIQYNKKDPRDAMYFIGPSMSQLEADYLLIDTLEGQMRACDGDWIIKGVNGEFYPCKPDIFEKTYEIVD